MKRLTVILLPALMLIACSSTNAPAPVDTGRNDDMILSGGIVLAGPELEPRLNAAIIVRDGRIDRIVSAAEAHAIAPDLPVIDLHGGTVLPGLVDAHAHLDSLGGLLDIVDLRGTRSFDEVVERLKARAAGTPADEWIEGRGWDQTRWDHGELPTAAMLDATGIPNPIWTHRVDGHAALANSAAMRAAGVTAATPTPDGGRIGRDASGNPNGIFVDNAKELISGAIPHSSREVWRSRIRRAAETIAANGLTEIHFAGTNTAFISDDELISIIEELIDAGQFPIRLYMMLSSDPQTIDRWLERGPLLDYGGRLTVRTIKFYVDGSLGSRSAALLEPYDDDPANRGLVTTPPERIARTARRAREAGFQVGTHAIGDRGTRIVLDAYSSAGAGPADRFRIEHAQVVALEDIPRFADMGVIASMQPTHATSDMRWAEQRVGTSRIRGAYAWRKMLDAGVHLAFGSDFPVESVNPFLGIYAAVTRQDLQGHPPGGWYPDEALTVKEAIRAFTAGAAFAAFEETSRGTIEPGKLADLTVVNVNPLAIDPSTLASVKVLYTIVGGRVSYSAGK